MRFVRLFVDNPVAANMMMFVVLLGGVVAAVLIPRELFPEFSRDVITVTVPYPGANPEDIERGVCLKLEDYLQNIEGIKEITSVSNEGMGVVSLELMTDADVAKVLDDVKSEVDKIEFPENAEDPVVREMTMKRQVIFVAIYGEADERTLKEIAQDVKDDLVALPDISQVSLSGVREYEISVEIDEKTLRQYGLTMNQIAQAIQLNSFDLPAGRVKTQTGELALRIVGQKYTAREYENIPVRYLEDGSVIYLRDIATVREAFEDVDIAGRFNGQPAAIVGVYKTGDEDTVKIAKAVRDYIATYEKTLPAGIHLAAWSDSSKVVSDRLDLLIRNGKMGLCLVIIILWFFLGFRLSFWVAMGIPVSIFGALMVMYFTGMTLNVMSMFALIMALGLIVDDAIVVGENIHTYTERGEMPNIAAVHGTHQVMFPVFGAVITTWIAFVPLLLIEGTMGKFIGQLPLIVILTLAFSLLECILILPSHLEHTERWQHSFNEIRDKKGWATAFFEKAFPWPLRMLFALASIGRGMRTKIDRGIALFLQHGFSPVYRLATRYRYITLGFCFAVVLVMLGAFEGGHIRQVVFPKSEADTLRASVVLPTGTPIERTDEVARRLIQAAEQLNGQIKTENGKPIVQQVYALIGQSSGREGTQGSHMTDVIVELLPSEERGPEAKSAKITKQWRENAGLIPDAISQSFGGFRGGPGGTPLELRVLANTTRDAKIVAERVKEKLASYEGVSDIQDDALPGKMEIKIRPNRKALSYGINQQVLASQLRDAFYGNESLEIQRGRDEIKVMVRFPDDRRQSLSDLETKRIRTPAGGEVPFLDVTDIVQERGYTTLRRVGGKSVVTVGADLDEDAANAEEILSNLQNSGFFTEATADIPGASIDLRGQRQQRTESLDSLKVWYPIALIGIYAVLAVIFKSYTQPLIVMVAIPFGLIGAVIGHWMLGFDITMLSMFGMVALAGIVVNDSLVLIDMVNSEVKSGEAVYVAAENGARKRFRPIFLTTITTVVGMMPLLMERSFQAQYLKPMAVSISFGLMFATMLTLLIVPCLFLIGCDVRRFWHWMWDGRWISPEEVFRKKEH